MSRIKIKNNLNHLRFLQHCFVLFPVENNSLKLQLEYNHVEICEDLFEEDVFIFYLLFKSEQSIFFFLKRLGFIGL